MTRLHQLVMKAILSLLFTLGLIYLFSITPNVLRVLKLSEAVCIFVGAYLLMSHINMSYRTCVNIDRIMDRLMERAERSEEDTMDCMVAATKEM